MGAEEQGIVHSTWWRAESPDVVLAGSGKRRADIGKESCLIRVGMARGVSEMREPRHEVAVEGTARGVGAAGIGLVDP